MNDTTSITWSEPEFTPNGQQSKEDFLNSLQIGLQDLSHEDRLWVLNMMGNFINTEIEKEQKEVEERLNYLKHLRK